MLPSEVEVRCADFNPLEQCDIDRREVTMSLSIGNGIFGGADNNLSNFRRFRTVIEPFADVD